jgi:hypothetical protein
MAIEQFATRHIDHISETIEGTLDWIIISTTLIYLQDRVDVTLYFDVVGPAGTMFVIETRTSQPQLTANTLSKYFNKIGG